MTSYRLFPHVTADGVQELVVIHRGEKVAHFVESDERLDGGYDPDSTYLVLDPSYNFPRYMPEGLNLCRNVRMGDEECTYEVLDRWTLPVNGPWVENRDTARSWERCLSNGLVVPIERSSEMEEGQWWK